VNETSCAAGASLKVLYRKPSQDKMLQNVFKVTLEVYQTQSVRFFVVTTKQTHFFKSFILATDTAQRSPSPKHKA